MSPEALVDHVMRDIAHGKDEVLPGKVRLLPMLMRLAPSLAARVVAELLGTSVRSDEPNGCSWRCSALGVICLKVREPPGPWSANSECRRWVEFPASGLAGRKSAPGWQASLPFSVVRLHHRA